MVAALTPPTDQSRPRLAGSGPAECSSCTDVSVVPDIVWDVNGYYRELGVLWWASRRELREAYQAKGGPDNARLTYVLKQLVNAEVRRAYDSMPLGSVFMDRYVADALKKQMLAHKSERMQALRDLGVDMDLISEESIERDIYSEMGLEIEDDTPVETVDGKPRRAQDGPRPASQFPYAYYLYRVFFPGREEVERLKDWQRFLVTALAREGIRIHFSVGIHGEKPYPWLYAEVGYRKVFFLGHREMPTEELAAKAVRQYRLDIEPQHTSPLAITGS